MHCSTGVLKRAGWLRVVSAGNGTARTLPVTCTRWWAGSLIMHVGSIYVWMLMLLRWEKQRCLASVLQPVRVPALLRPLLAPPQWLLPQSHEVSTYLNVELFEKCNRATENHAPAAHNDLNEAFRLPFALGSVTIHWHPHCWKVLLIKLRRRQET